MAKFEITLSTSCTASLRLQLDQISQLPPVIDRVRFISRPTLRHAPVGGKNTAG